MRAIYPSDITREQFSVIEYTPPLYTTCMMFFARFCTFSKKVVPGAAYRTMFPSGTSFTTSRLIKLKGLV
jgi:hypothetical protein